MEHKMKLNNEPFLNIKSANKTIEMRLYDEKRKLIKVGDTIEFINITTNEKLIVKVIKLHLFNNFEELYKNFDKVSLGYKENEKACPSDMNKYYLKEEQQNYGVVGIEIKLF